MLMHPASRKTSLVLALAALALAAAGIFAYLRTGDNGPRQPGSPANEVGGTNGQEPLEEKDIRGFPSQSAVQSVTVTSLEKNQEVQSPISLEGEAVGSWYFEASFPVVLVDADWNELAAGVAQASPAEGESWMTEKMVPFKAVLSFENPKTREGWIVLKRDNPSGLPENDAEVHFPVRFPGGQQAAQPGGPGTEECRPTGCSGEICAEEEAATNCIYKPEYACYRLAECKRQQDGRCGWTESPGLANCLNSAK